MTSCPANPNSWPCWPWTRRARRRHTSPATATSWPSTSWPGAARRRPASTSHRRSWISRTRAAAIRLIPRASSPSKCRRTCPACPANYTRPWPSAAELDTFLYARGGVPWRCVHDPAGATSVPGLLAGYAFDTLGTRLGLEFPADAAPLSRLGQYRHVLWLVDQRSAESGAFPGPVTPPEAMSGPRRASSLAAHVAAGGEAWVAGGGAAPPPPPPLDTRQ